MVRTIWFALAMALATLPSLANACDDHAPGKEPAPKATTRPSSLVAGEVLEVDAGGPAITLAHGRIASPRMQPMGSMLFKVQDANSIAGLKPGDKVKFRVRLVGDQPEITQIRPDTK